MNNRKDFHTLPDWQNTAVTEINRGGAHTRWGAYDSEASAAKGGYGASPCLRSLNGEYAFRLYENPGAVDDFYRPDYDAKAFAPIQVPGNWETQGFGEPIYTNIVFPWSMGLEEDCVIEAAQGQRVPNPPYVPAANPTGCYRRFFTVPESFAGRRVFLRFEGVETAYYLWVNGKPVGYSQDSKLPGEFDITDHLQPGENLLALQVMRFADATYVEDQDYWYLSGIYRDVWLVAKPDLAIEDCKVKAVPDLHRGGGAVTADVTVTRVKGFADCTVRVGLFGPDGEKIAEGEGPVQARADYRTDRIPTAGTARVTLSLDKASLWSPESPALYTAVVTLLDKDGSPLDFESTRFGFKLLEVKDGVVHLNGERLVIHGVNRHEHAWKTGRTVSREHMIEEIRQMKRMNINSVRTCHYPDSPLWYDLCDEYGLLLVCECNLETHGVMGALTHDPAWAGVFLERAKRMVQNYKNHVSIYSWSLGNESGTGPNHAAMYGFIKEYDPTRLCQYEAGNPGKNISDVRGNMYATLENIMDMLCDPVDDRPIILVEYLYQIRNSGGGMDNFIRLTQQCPRFQGGYIWDWQDKCLLGKTADGGEFFAYGGDFGESFVEGEDCPPFMTNNGIVLPDLRWKPVAYEVRQAYCPIRFDKPSSHTAWQTVAPWDRFVVRRAHGMHGDYSCTAILRENGLPVAEVPVELPALAPGEEKEFGLSIPHEKKPGGLYTVELVLRQQGGTFYAEDGYELSRTQFPLESGAAEPATANRPLPAVNVTQDGGSYAIAGEGFRVRLDKATGELTALEKNGAAYLEGGASPCLDRPLTGLDTREGWGWYEEYAKVRGLTRRITGSRLLTGEGSARIEFDFVMESEGARPVFGALCYTVGGDGGLAVDFDIHIDESYQAVPRVGVELKIPAGFEALRYLGVGPAETYSDRLLAGNLGVWDSTVEGEHFPFVPPSECGGHEGTRWLTLSDGKAALRVSSAAPFHFDVHHSTVADYIAAGHDHQLPRRGESYLHIDAAHGPIGGEMAWSIAMPEGFAVKGGDYHLSFCIEML